MQISMDACKLSVNADLFFTVERCESVYTEKEGRKHTITKCKTLVRDNPKHKDTHQYLCDRLLLVSRLSNSLTNLSSDRGNVEDIAMQQC